MLMNSPFFKGLDDFFDSKWVSFATTDTAFPMDIIERDSEYEVKIAVPGVNRENLDVPINDGNLEINATGGATAVNESDTYLLRGLKNFEYKRTIPQIVRYGVLEDKISSVYKDVILSIVLPKAEEVKPKVIPVTVE